MTEYIIVFYIINTLVFLLNLSLLFLPCPSTFVVLNNSEQYWRKMLPRQNKRSVKGSPTDPSSTPDTGLFFTSKKTKKREKMRRKGIQKDANEYFRIGSNFDPETVFFCVFR